MNRGEGQSLFPSPSLSAFQIKMGVEKDAGRNKKRKKGEENKEKEERECIHCILEN